MADKRDSIDVILRRPYRREIVPTSEGSWIGSVRELPGCVTEGDSPSEAATMLEDAMQVWIETAWELGLPIPEPEPQPLRTYSGRFNVRLPVGLHRTLAEQAQKNASSLNEYCVYLLAEGVGKRTGFSREGRTALQDVLSEVLRRHTEQVAGHSTWNLSGGPSTESEMWSPGALPFRPDTPAKAVG